MDKGWKSTLFQLPQDKFTLNPLGFPVSRTRGSEILGVCFRTWMRWERLAMLIPEYKLQHKRLEKKAAELGIIPPVIPYMVWCVGKIGEIFDGLPHGLAKKWMVEEFVKSQQEQFTRQAYLDEQTRFAERLLEVQNVHS